MEPSTVTTELSPTEPEVTEKSPFGGPLRLAKVSWEYVRHVGWLLAAKLALDGIDIVGIMLWGLWPHESAVVILLTTNPVVMIASAHHMPWPVFFTLAIPRMLVGSPVNYLLGRRSKTFYRTKRTQKQKIKGKLSKAGEPAMLITVFVSVVFSLPFFPGLSIHNLAGAQGTNPRRVAIVTVLATVGRALMYYELGQAIDVTGFVENLFQRVTPL